MISARIQLLAKVQFSFFIVLIEVGKLPVLIISEESFFH